MHSRSQSTHQRPAPIAIAAADSSMHARPMKSMGIDYRHSSHHRPPVLPVQPHEHHGLSLSDHSISPTKSLRSPQKMPVHFNDRGMMMPMQQQHPHNLYSPQQQQQQGQMRNARLAHLANNVHPVNINGSTHQRSGGGHPPSPQQQQQRQQLQLQPQPHHGSEHRRASQPSSQQQHNNGFLQHLRSPTQQARPGPIPSNINNVHGDPRNTPPNRNIRSASTPRPRSADHTPIIAQSHPTGMQESTPSVPWAAPNPNRSSHRRPNHPPPPLSNGGGGLGMMQHPHMHSPHRPRPDHHVMAAPQPQQQRYNNMHHPPPALPYNNHATLNPNPVHRNPTTSAASNMVGGGPNAPLLPRLPNTPAHGTPANGRGSLIAHKRPSLQTTAKDVLQYFNTNGSAKHTDHKNTTTASNSNNSSNMAWPPRPIDGSAGSRMRLFFGATCRQFVAFFQEDDGDKSWQSRIWCNIPMGLDSKLRTIDRIDHCSFSDTERFILTYCEQTHKHKSTWSVESQALHTTLAAYAQSNTPVRLVLGENGQFVILHGTNGYQVGPNTPTQLQIALDRAYSNGDKIVSIHGLNAHGRFLMHAMKKAQLDDSNHSGGDTKERNSFCAIGLSTQLDHVLKTSNKLEYSEFVLSIKDTSWLVVFDHSFDRTDDIHYDLITELDGFYARHKKRQSKRSAEIEGYFNERSKNTSAKIVAEVTTLKNIETKPSKVDEINRSKVNALNVASKPSNDSPLHDKAKSTDETIPNRGNDNVYDSIERNKQEAKAKDNSISNNHRQEKQKAKEVKKQQKKIKPSILRAKKLQEKEDRLSEIMRKSVAVGDKVTVLGNSTFFGDFVVQSIERNDGILVARKKNTTVAISDIRTIIKFEDGEDLTKYSGMFQESLPADKYEAAMQLYHLHREAGTCECKNTIFVSADYFQQPNSWKIGDRVNVIGYADGTVIHNKPKYSDKPYLIHVQYDDGSSYHVRSERVRPVKRYVDPGQCFFASTRSIEEPALRLRPVLDETKALPFDEYSCAEKIDLRRLQKLIANITIDSLKRKECMKQLVARLIEDPNDEAADNCYGQLEHCYDLEEALLMLFEKIKSLPMDDHGCVVHQVQYSHKDLSCYGRLYAIGPYVRVLHGKFPRTATIQGLHAELRAPLTGAFSHEVQLHNSDIDLLCSLAQQLGMEDKIPTLIDYCDNSDQWLVTIRQEHPSVRLSAIKQLVSMIVYGGSYESWLDVVGETDVVPKLKRFGFCLKSEIYALGDQLLHCPRFQWTFLEQKKLESIGLPAESIRSILLIKILHACENEVLRIIHRIFHDQGYIVRAKIFDSINVEKRSVESENEKQLSLEKIMDLAEQSCREMGWDVHLVEKELHGLQDRQLASFVKARTSMKQYIQKLNRRNSKNANHRDETSVEHDDDDLITTVTRSVGTLNDDAFSMDDSYSSNRVEDMFDMLGTSLHNSESFGDLRNESTFHSESDTDNDPK